jgi:hypothetical protein
MVATSSLGIFPQLQRLGAEQRGGDLRSSRVLAPQIWTEPSCVCRRE